MVLLNLSFVIQTLMLDYLLNLMLVLSSCHTKVFSYGLWSSELVFNASAVVLICCLIVHI